MRPHKCQSKLWRCANLGHHPKWAICSRNGAWLVHRPRTAWAVRFPKDGFTQEQLLDAARTDRIHLLAAAEEARRVHAR